MDLELTPDDEAFRDELRAWLGDHLVGAFREHLGGAARPTIRTGTCGWSGNASSCPADGSTSPGPSSTAVAAEPPRRRSSSRSSTRGRAPFWVGVNGRDLLGPTLLLHGTAEQKQRFLPAIMRAEEFWGQGFSEPNAGSDLASLRTRAELDGDAWVINGQKIWMTMGNYADWMYMLCRTGTEESRHRGITMLLVDAHQPGVDVRPIRNIAGGLEFCEVFFDDVRTPADLVVGEVNGGWNVAMDTLGMERTGAMSPYMATFEAEMTRLLDEVKRRRSARRRCCASDSRRRGPVCRCCST